MQLQIHLPMKLIGSRGLSRSQVQGREPIRKGPELSEW